MLYSKDGTLSKDSGLHTYNVEATKRREAAGYCCAPGAKLEKWVKDAGFVNVKVVKYPVPLGTWAKDPKYVSIKSSLQHMLIRNMNVELTRTCHRSEKSRGLELLPARRCPRRDGHWMPGTHPRRGKGMVPGRDYRALRPSPGRDEGSSYPQPVRLVCLAYCPSYGA